MRSRFASPGDDYLGAIGELAFAVSSLEGMLIFDVPRLAPALPPSLTVVSLAGGTTRGIGQRFLDAALTVSDSGVRLYCEVGGQALRDVGSIRNDVLHARPATTVDGDQRLYRWVSDKAFFLEKSWLERAIDDVAALSDSANAARPSFADWPA
jgi:hypothetical protein